MAVGLLLPPLLPLHPHCTVPRPHNHQFRNPRTFSPISCSSSSSSSSSWEREESRWLREEQRWLREEQRWVREESRWNSERDSLLREVAALRMRVETLQRRRRKPVDDDDEFDGIDVAIGEAKPPAVLVEEADVKEMVVVEEGRMEAGVEEEKKKKGRRVLRKGAEGADVKEMQEALEKLGFYSGEEDMEFSTFSIGTERAVKTWQASLGTREDGIMSSELLEKLFMGPVGEDAGSKVKSDQENDKMTGTDKSLPEGGTNGAPFSSVTEIKQTAIDTMEVDIPEHGVFLLGENRWEEPSRLLSRDKPTKGSKPTSSKKCLTCRGEGRLMCTECDGTGEPNIEPQFLEWVDEGTKCPYCDGLGYTTCDVCEGKTVIDN